MKARCYGAHSGAWRSRALGAVGLGLLACGAVGCLSIDGGSIEASWVVNTAQGGKRIDCACARFGAVRLEVVGVGDDVGVLPCEAAAADGGSASDAGGGAAGGDASTAAAARDPRCEFECGLGVGTTEFFIPPGRYRISITPIDLGGKVLTPADGVAVPAPAVRAVKRGEVTDIGVHLIAAQEARLAGPSACSEDVLTPP